MEKNQVITGDCLPILTQLPNESIDVVISDVPYPSSTNHFAHNITDAIAALYLAAKKTKKYIVFFWSPRVDPPLPPPGWREVATHVWNKTDTFSPIKWERIIVWSTEPRLQPCQVFTVPIVDFRSLKFWQRHNGHPTQKPIKLMMQLVRLYTSEGDFILDPFAGTGATALAAKILKRDYLAIEHNADYAAFARERLKIPPVDGVPSGPTALSDTEGMNE